MAAVMATTKKRVRIRIPSQKLQWLESVDARRTIEHGQRRLQIRELEKRRDRLWLRVPSAPWFDGVWYRGETTPETVEIEVLEFTRLTPGEEPKAGCWHQCNVCNRSYPPAYIGSSGACMDCRINAMSPMRLAKLDSSPSGRVISQARAMGIRLSFR
jgi:hypothetical protein